MALQHLERPIFNNFPKEKLMRTLDQTELQLVSGAWHWPFPFPEPIAPSLSVTHPPVTGPVPVPMPWVPAWQPVIW